MSVVARSSETNTPFFVKKLDNSKMGFQNFIKLTFL